MKKRFHIISGLILLSMTSISATAQQHEVVLEPPQLVEKYVYVPVLRVSPVYHYVTRTTPVRECWDEPVPGGGYGYYPGNRAGAALAGGLLGGVIGHQIGDGRGQDVATALGTIVGAQMGYDSAMGDYQGNIQYRSVCETVNKEEGFEVVQDGYQVSYLYQGKEFHTQLPYHPGERLKLKVQVEKAAN